MGDITKIDVTGMKTERIYYILWYNGLLNHDFQIDEDKQRHRTIMSVLS